MKILALFHFYLPFPLPRSEDWEEALLVEEQNGATLELAPMRRKEALFPRPVDEALGQLVVSVGVPGSSWSSGQRTMADSCIDRIRVHVFFDGLEADTKNPRVQHHTWKMAAEQVDTFLRHCRASSGDWNISGFPRDHNGEIIPIDQFPYTVAWFDAKDGMPLLGGNGSEEVRGATLRVIPARRVAFASIAKAIAARQEPGLAQCLLVDAEGHLGAFRQHEAGILIGTACEIASDRYIARKAALNDPTVGSLLRKRSSFAVKRFHLVTLHISKRSLRQEQQKVFDDVEAAYRLRNDLAHEAKMTSWPGAYLASARHAIDWLDSL